MYDVNLYPPIFNSSYMPAFIYTGSCRVYFDMSPLNTKADLYHNGEGTVQVSIRTQKDNSDALNSSYKNNIIMKSIQTNTNSNINAQYYIDINRGDMLNSIFALNQYYKVQIRFTSKNAKMFSNDENNAVDIPSATSNDFGGWLEKNLDNFSEWSSIVLIRGIAAPDFSAIKVNDIAITSYNTLTVDTDYLLLSGSVSFTDTQRLQRYRVYLLDSNNNIIQDSSDIYSENGEVNYLINTSLPLKRTTCILKIVFTTNNLYQISITKSITYNGSSDDPQNLALQEIVDNNNGYIKIKLKRNLSYVSNNESTGYEYYTFEVDSNGIVTFIAYQGANENQRIAKMDEDTAGSDENFAASILSLLGTTASVSGNAQMLVCKDDFTLDFLQNGDRIVIRRASNKDNFAQWKYLTEFNVTKNNLAEINWFDYTAEPGIWYRYQVVKYNSLNEKKAELTTNINTPVMLDTNDIFLNANGEELIIKFDPSISNLTTKTAESITDTIGSKYPFFRRNGNINYKTFSLSGTISCFMDLESNVFHSTPSELYGDSAKYYKNYNNKNHINIYNDFIYERFFREKVIKFLQSSDVKLLRSLTEGNMLVKLSNISFTPNQTLGRKIYNFSCTAYEVADCNEKNYEKFNITNKETIEITKI